MVHSPVCKVAVYYKTHQTNLFFITFTLLYIKVVEEDIFISCCDQHHLVKVMVFNATFNNISVISWRPVLLVEETGVHRENHRPVTSHWRTLSHNVVLSTTNHERVLNSQL